MEALFNAFSPVNAFFTMVILFVGAVIIIAQSKRMGSEHIHQALEDYQQINTAKDVRLQGVEKDLNEAKAQLSNLTLEIGRIQGQNEWLMRERFFLERHCEALEVLLKEHGFTIPERERARRGRG